MREHVLVVGTGREFPARVREACPGARTTVFVRIESLHKVRDPARNAAVLALPAHVEDKDWIAVAQGVHERTPFTRIMTVGERDQDRCAAIGAALGLHTHHPDTVSLVHDKRRMRARLRERGVDTTAYGVAQDADDVRTFLAEHGPCIVKPADGMGSAGVARVGTAADVDAAWARASGEHDGTPGAGVLVEEFHEGPQYSVEGFSEAGEHVLVSVTRKYSDPVTFVELGHVAPAPLPAGAREAIEEYVTRALDALGVELGATHTEIVLGAHGPRIIETHLRYGGDEIPELTLEATGVDLSDAIVRQTLGEPVLPSIRATLADDEAPRPASAIWFAALPGRGTLDEITGVADAEAVPGVTAVTPAVRPGAELTGLDSSDSRLASVRASAPAPDDAVAAARAGVAALRFVVRSGADPVEAV